MFIELPFEVCPEAMVPDIEKKDQISIEENGQPVLSGKHFLCAEDNELNAELLVSILELEGAECTVYENGKLLADAFETVQPGECDAILMDIQMPVMNGYEATRTIRNSRNPLGKTIPIIAMTANAFEEDKKMALASGMNDHVAKPIDMNILLPIIMKYV